MNSQDILNKKEKQLVYLSASIASGCRPCTKYHFKKGVDAGLTDDEIRKTLALILSIKDQATNDIISLIQKQKVNENRKDEKQESLSRNNLLTGIAATYSVNFPSALEKYLSIATNNGISVKVIDEIINLSKFVFEKARAHTDMVIDKTGISQKGENKRDCCCC